MLDTFFLISFLVNYVGSFFFLGFNCCCSMDFVIELLLEWNVFQCLPVFWQQF
jgi:hypothetical protein